MKSEIEIHCIKLTGIALALSVFSVSLVQASTIWGTSASFGNVNIEAFDTTTGLLISGQQFLVPNLTARSDNGRGIAVSGDTIYYTTANSGNIYVTNSVSHADLGILVKTGFSGIANVATDGKFIYANNYQSSSGIINKYNFDGSSAGTVTVGAGFSGRDGFEVQNNSNLDGGATTFISNRGDGQGPYDVYKSDGSLLISSFIDPSKDGGSSVTGIAYDGLNYFVSDIFKNRLLEYSGTGTFLMAIDLSGNPNTFTQRLLEDLSAVGNTIDNPPPNAVPLPAALPLMSSALGLFGLGALRRRNKS